MVLPFIYSYFTTFRMTYLKGRKQVIFLIYEKNPLFCPIYVKMNIKNRENKGIGGESFVLRELAWIILIFLGLIFIPFETVSTELNKENLPIHDH